MAGLMVGQTACPGNRVVDDPAPPLGPAGDADGRTADARTALPRGVSAADLDRDERRVLVATLREVGDPCGGAGRLFDRLDAEAPCPLATALGQLAVVKVSQGLAARQVVHALRDEQARRSRRATFDVASAPAWGDPSKARHVIVEFFDFECPYCAMAGERVRELAGEHGAVVYAKMLPLARIHKHAMAAARAALAAHRQGQFWAVSDALFARQRDLHTAPIDSPVVRDIVRTVRAVDQDRFDADLRDPALTADIERDVAEARRAAVDGTPTFFVDDVMVEFDDLERALEAAP